MSAVAGTTSKPTNATIFTANESSGNAAALDIVARIQGRVVVVANLPGRFTRIKSAVKGLNLSRPELEVACGVVGVTREGDLRGSTREHVQDLSVCRDWLGCGTEGVVGVRTGNIAELVVVEHRFAPLVTSHSPRVVIVIVLRGCRVGLSP